MAGTLTLRPYQGCTWTNGDRIPSYTQGTPPPDIQWWITYSGKQSLTFSKLALAKPKSRLHLLLPTIVYYTLLHLHLHHHDWDGYGTLAV
jgi:hypothetical protein